MQLAQRDIDANELPATITPTPTAAKPSPTPTT